MDFENIIYLVGGIIYLLYSANKGAKKHKQNRPGQSRPKPEPRQEERRSTEDKIREMLEQKRAELQKENTRRTEDVLDSRETYLEEQEHEKEIIEAQRRAEQRAREAEERLRRINERYSVESDTTPLKEHVTMKTLERKTVKPSRAYQLVRNGRFDPKKAFVFSEIFNKKY